MLGHKILWFVVCFITLHPPRLQLHSTATQLAADLLKYHADHMVLKALKLTGVEGNLEGLAECACKFSEQKEQLVEVSDRFTCSRNGGLMVAIYHQGILTQMQFRGPLREHFLSLIWNSEGVMFVCSDLTAVRLLKQNNPNCWNPQITSCPSSFLCSP